MESRTAFSLTSWFAGLAGAMGWGGRSPETSSRGDRHRIFQTDLIDHAFIIYALILREAALRHGKGSRVGFLAELVTPAIIVVLHIYLFTTLHRFMPAHIPVGIFVLSGFSTWLVFRHTASRRMRSGEVGDGILLAPNVTQFHFLTAVALWECALMMILLFSGLVLLSFGFGRDMDPDISAVIFILLITAIMGTGFRLVFESLARVIPLASAVRGPITLVMFLTSGIYFNTQGSQRDFIVKISWYNPLSHLLEPQRAAIYPGYPVAHVTIFYGIAWAIGLVFLGMLLNRLIKPRGHK